MDLDPRASIDECYDEIPTNGCHDEVLIYGFQDSVETSTCVCPYLYVGDIDITFDEAYDP